MIPTKNLKASLIVSVSFIFLFSCKRDTTYLENTKVANNKTIMAQAVISPTCNNINIDKHFITLQYAYTMINNFQRATKKPGFLGALFDKSGWVYAETFPIEVIQKIITQPNCCKYRIYNGLDVDNRLHLIMVGVNSLGVDVLFNNEIPNGKTEGISTANVLESINELGLIAEMGAPCPQACSSTYVAP